MTMPTLVLIPGLGSDAAVWRPTMAALDSAARCIVGDTLHDASLAGMAATVLRQAPARFALAGVSMGGMVALELMKIAPERVTHLALVDTTAWPDTFKRRVSRRLANLAVRFGGDFRQLAARSVGALVHPDAPEAVREDLIAMSVRVGPATYRRQNRALAARPDLSPVLPGIAVPTAVIVGSDDRLTPESVSRDMHRRVPGSTLHVVADCGHLPPIERPEAVAAHLRTLLQR